MKKIALLCLLFVSFLTKAKVVLSQPPIDVYVHKMHENLDKNKPLTLQEAFDHCVNLYNLNRKKQVISCGEKARHMTPEEANVCEKIFFIMQEKLEQFVQENAKNNTKEQ